MIVDIFSRIGAQQDIETPPVFGIEWELEALIEVAFQCASKHLGYRFAVSGKEGDLSEVKAVKEFFSRLRKG